MNDELLRLVASYFKWKDIPPGWGFAKQKHEAENRLRRYLKQHYKPPSKMIVIRGKK